MEKADEKSDSPLQGVRNASEDSSSFDAVVENMAIAHEMTMNADFKLNEVPSDSIRGQVKRIVHQAFWDVLQEDISKDPPNYEHAIKLLAEIKEVLISLTFEHNSSLREQINDILDIDLIKQQSEHDIVDIQGYATFIIQIMSKICVPARDDDIKKLTTVEGNLVPLLREIFHVLDMMKLDMANYRLSVLRPQILQQSVEYEREKFRQFLNANPNGLLSTKQWIKRGVIIAKNELKDISKRNTEVDSADSSHSRASGSNNGHDSAIKVELVDVCKHCYVGILLSEGGFPYPETLIMDSHRIAVMRVYVQSLIKLTSVLAVTLNIVGSHLASDAEYKKAIKESVLHLLRGLRESDLTKAFPNICEQVIKETESFSTKRELISLDEEKSSLLREQIMCLSDDGNNICQLIRKRLYDLLMNGLLQQPTASNSSMLTVPVALLDIENEIVDITKRFNHLVSHNYAVFQPFYEEIQQNIQAEF